MRHVQLKQPWAPHGVFPFLRWRRFGKVAKRGTNQIVHVAARDVRLDHHDARRTSERDQPMDRGPQQQKELPVLFDVASTESVVGRAHRNTVFLGEPTRAKCASPVFEDETLCHNRGTSADIGNVAVPAGKRFLSAEKNAC